MGSPSGEDRFTDEKKTFCQTDEIELNSLFQVVGTNYTCCVQTH